LLRAMWDGTRSPDVLLVSVILDETIYGLWFIEIPEHGQDWLGSIKRNDDGTYTMNYRHRYYKDDKIFDSEDEKSWYKATDTLEKLLDCVEITKDSATRFFGADNIRITSLLKEGKTFDEFMAEFHMLPFVHQELSSAH